MGIKRRHKDFNNLINSEQPNELFNRLNLSVQFATIIGQLVKYSRNNNLEYQVGHLIRRIIYDKICASKWEDKIKPAFVDNCNVEELSKAIKLAEILLTDRTLFRTLCAESKGYRVK